MPTAPLVQTNSSTWEHLGRLETHKIDSNELLLNPVAVLICQWVTFSVICQLIDVFGTVTNIINITCFIKQGFQDPVNISLLGLAVSDLGCLTSLIWTNICLTPAFSASDLPFDPPEFQYLTGGWPHITFTRVTSCITAFITLERCLCITAPFKVNLLCTPKRVWIIIITMFTILTFSVAPVYCVNKLGLKYFLDRNKTLIGLVFTPDRESVEKVSFAINNVFVSFSSFMIIIVCTIILTFQLRKNARWREMASSIHCEKAQHLSNRNMKVAKMVVMISTLFIACFVPVSIICLAMSLEPELSAEGKYRDIIVMLSGFCFSLESINSSANIFIYLNMSSKYKETFNQLFSIKKVDRSNK